MITKKNFYWIFMLLGLFMIIFFIMIHEVTHQTIFEYYGIKSEISFNNFPTIETIPESNCPTGACDIAQTFNEVVGCSLISVLVIVYFIFGVFYYNKLLKESKKNEKL